METTPTDLPDLSKLKYSRSDHIKPRENKHHRPKFRDPNVYPPRLLTSQRSFCDSCLSLSLLAVPFRRYRPLLLSFTHPPLRLYSPSPAPTLTPDSPLSVRRCPSPSTQLCCTNFQKKELIEGVRRLDLEFSSKFHPENRPKTVRKTGQKAPELLPEAPILVDTMEVV